MKKKSIIILCLVSLIILILLVFSFFKSNNKMINLVGKNIDEVREYVNKYTLDLQIVEQYNDDFPKDQIIGQSINENEAIKKGDKLTVYVSLGKIDKDVYAQYGVNELGRVPIMMYHGIQNIEDNKYTGGNIDKDGYQRTAKAFREDLEFYYNEGYRMIKLSDYINGRIDVELGKSPIIITFDDGISNNALVTGLDENGEIIIDPNSAVGILESFKEKYPDFNVTATFFLNAGLFNQPQYNEKIISWLVDHGYSVANHSYSHANFSQINEQTAIKEIGSMYNILNKIIPGKYENIVALPYGSPYAESATNFKHILSGSYNDIEYNTIATLRVGWESELSPFHKSFNKTFLKRIRAYDNNGKEFDIEMNFSILKNTRYISDGNVNTIVVPEKNKDNVKGDYNVITY